MLIKIQTAHHADSFLLIDRVDSVRYEGTPKSFTGIDELGAHINTMSYVESSRLVLDPRGAGAVFPVLPEPGVKPEDFIGILSESRVYRLNTLTYERDGQMHSVTFDTIAYICTDEGKTLERALAGGILNY